MLLRGVAIPALVFLAVLMSVELRITPAEAQARPVLSSRTRLVQVPGQRLRKRPDLAAEQERLKRAEKVLKEGPAAICRGC